MTTKTKAPVREGVSKAKAPIRNGLAALNEFLDSNNLAGSISSALERSEVVLVAQGIVEKLQGIAEDLSTIEAKDIMPLLDSLTNAFGPQSAQSFNTVATEQVRQLITAVQGAKTAMDGEIMRLKQGVEGGDMSDMGMDAGAQPMMPGAEPPMEEPGAEPEAGALPDMPPDVTGNAEDDAMGGGFAGREKKIESRNRPIGTKKIVEYETPIGDIGVRQRRDVAAPHSHESASMEANIHNFALYHPKAGKMAQSIRGMISTEELSGSERKGLAEVLSHIAAFGNDPAHWGGVNADKKMEMLLQSAGIWKVEKPAVEKIVTQMKRLAHLLSMHHDGMLESNIAMLRKAADPDAIILKMFRTKLAEHKDAQMAAIRAARAFAIDIEDVVAVVKEAAARRPFPRVNEFRADLNPAKKGMFKDKNIDAIQGDLSKQKKKSKAAQARGEKVPDEVATKEREDNFAIRAKKGWKGKVSEDSPSLMQGVPMFPVEQGSAASSITKNPMDAPTNSEPQNTMTFAPGAPVPGNSAPSVTGAPTNGPQSPAIMRARQNAEVQQDAVKKAQAPKPQPTGNQPQTGNQPSSGNPKPQSAYRAADDENTQPTKPRGFMQK